MKIVEAQEAVRKFNTDRNWLNDYHDLKDLLLNMCEESSEAWNLIKWVDLKKQKELVKQHQDEWEDFVGDQFYLVLKVACLTGINPEKALIRSLKEFEQRFPIEKVKGKHSNLNAGGIDLKYTKGK